MEEVRRTVDDERQLVVFRLYGEEFGIEITKVREIVKPREITRLPNVAEFVEGVTNLRGEVIPIIDLKKRFGLEATAMTEDSRIIIVDISENRVGLVVDDVTEVLRISGADIEPPPRTVAGLKAEYIQGIGKVGERLLILLDVEKILTTAEKIELKTELLQEDLAAAASED
ncbi:MAG: purine-binding chemotaxis protein CheW [Firmicutes bacterium]|nr:purine-binding chemotaxis protein CheW [Bacillota bacterium]